LNFAAAYADHIVMMNDGRIVASGPTVETLTAERVEAVFQVPVYIMLHPQTGRPWCMPRTDGTDMRLAAE
jgi:iron complex transport system ATP-binding protein